MLLPVPAIALLICLSPAGAGAGNFDSAAVRSAYLEGEFDMVLDILTSEPGPSTRSDSLTFYRYLGAVCLKEEDTYEQAAVYLRRLLDLEPREDMEGMYLSTKALLSFNVIKNEKLGKPGLGTADPEAMKAMLDSLIEARQKNREDSLRTARELHRREERMKHEAEAERLRKETESRRKNELVAPSASRYWALPAGLLCVAGLGLLLMGALSL